MACLLRRRLYTTEREHPSSRVRLVRVIKEAFDKSPALQCRFGNTPVFDWTHFDHTLSEHNPSYQLGSKLK
jgi:hypothetical protein